MKLAPMLWQNEISIGCLARMTVQKDLNVGLVVFKARTVSLVWASCRGGGQGGHIVPLDLDVCKNSGRFWRVDCLLFVY